MHHAKLLFVLVPFLWLAPQADAQKDQYLRTNPKFVATFREVVAKPSASTVRIVCDGKETALGMVVGADGWILTKANDLKGTISCRFRDGREFEAKIIGVHKEHDLAMLKIEAKDLSPIKFTASKGVDAGSWVACAGLTAEPVAIGVVSVSTRAVLNKNPTFTFDNSKIGFLGVGLELVEGSVTIKNIEPRSAADKAGLKKEDIVISLGGKPMQEVEAFTKAIGKSKPGDSVTLKIRRDNEEREIIATLGKRPSLARGDIQNKMGSELSSRRTGYSTILQHDSVVKPSDCGGPIVDLDGRVIGINICRAGRTESWAVPSEVLETVLADLKSGKLAPPEPEQATNRVAGEKEKAQAVSDLLGLIKERLDVSVDVARFKYVNKQAIIDGKREKGQLSRFVQSAEEEGLDKKLARDFIDAQTAASRKLQEDLHARWTKEEKSLKTADIPDLKQTLRPKLDQISQELIEALGRAQPFLREPAIRQLLRQRAAELLRGDGISDAVREKALENWLPSS